MGLHDALVHTEPCVTTAPFLQSTHGKAFLALFPWRLEVIEKRCRTLLNRQLSRRVSGGMDCTTFELNTNHPKEDRPP